MLALTALFYKMPRVILAPNREWLRVLEQRTGRPVFLMTRGIDTDHFSPGRRARSGGDVNIGYVGRLSPEKNVRVLARLEAAFVAAGRSNVRFTIVGDGSERGWLTGAMTRAAFPGILRGEALADAYADLDLFVFPSETETVGNVVLEAMASGVPVVAMNRGGHRFVVDSDSAALAETDEDFIRLALELSGDRARLNQMGRAGRLAALDRSWGAVFGDVYRAYSVAILMARAEARTPETLEKKTLVSARGEPPLA
jgi:glycosyltransferase involved in cell wall biosynthesis